MRYAQVNAKHVMSNVIYGAVYYGVSDPAEAIRMFQKEYPECTGTDWTVLATIYD